MQVDTPHHTPSTMRGFILQYAMIVLSILTALALEQAVLSIHNASTARDSRARIESELSGFLADLKNSTQINTERLTKVNAVLTTLNAKLKTGAPDEAAIMALGQQVIDHIGISLPTYQRDAWDTAIADQSVSHLALADLQRYSAIYSAELVLSDETRLLLTGEYVQRLSDAILDFHIGKLDGHSLAQALTLDSLAGQEIVNHQKALISLIETGHESK
jgi:uncharacterized protein YejL (UPF0352 family)